MAKKEKIRDAVSILHGRYVKDDSERKAAIQEERVNAEVARLIYNIRTNAGLSQQQLAELIGTTQSVVSRLEDSDYEGRSLSMLDRIAQALNQKLSVMMTAREPQAQEVRENLQQVANILRRTRRLGSFRMENPTVFISYSHDSVEHKHWVLSLAEELVKNGIDVTLDQWDLSLGQDTAAFMQRGIAEADRVLLVCTEAYVTKAEAGRGNVGYERLVVTAELVQNIDTKKFIPLIRDNSSNRKVPAFLGPRLYLDFSSNGEFKVKLDQLLRELHGAPANVRPSLGPNPFSGAIESTSPRRIAGSSGVTSSGEVVLDDPWFTKHAAEAQDGLAEVSLSGLMELRFALHNPISTSQIDLLNAMRKSEIRTFGWPIGVVMDIRDDQRPRPLPDGIKAEIAISNHAFTGCPSYDYWALRTNGDFYLLQSLFEDERKKGELFFNTRIVRIAEALLFCANLYDNLGVLAETNLSVRITHSGLAGRLLTSSSPFRDIPFPRRTSENVSQTQFVETLGHIRNRLTEDVRKVAESMFMLFDFEQFGADIYEDIVTSFIGGRVA